MQRAFSLVELSIVLVILGLLTGGILAGQSLVRAAELRAVTTEQNRYQVALKAFRDKYFAYPGDMTNATSFWGDQATGTNSCADAAITNGTPGTCNGNGNGQIPATGTEDMRMWQQLALAGLIEGNYVGYYTGAFDFLAGTNVPASKVGGGAYWVVDYLGNTAGDTNFFAGDYQEYMTLLTNTMETLKPEDAWNIDSKIDDGKPGQGRMRATKSSPTSVACTTVDGVAPAGDSAGAYNLTGNAKVCTVMFLKIL